NQTMPYLKDRMADILKMSDAMQFMINNLQHMYGLLQQVDATTHDLAENTNELTAITDELRDHSADFDDFFRPLRNYFYWEPHCFDIPVCAALRSVFDALDGIDALTDQFGQITTSLDKLNALQPKLLALLPPQIASQQINRDLALTNYATTSGIDDQTAAALQNSTAMGQ